MDGKKAFRKKAKVHKTETVYKGKLFSFVTEDITLPNGAGTEMAIVRYPGSTGIVPLLDDAKIIMLSQYRHSVGDYLLEIPAGTMEPGESPLNCARRELEEETGLVASEFIELAQVYIIPAYSDEKIHVYLARGFTRSKQNLDQDEIIHVVKYPFQDVLRMIGQGLITDALTILSIQQAHMYIQNEDSN
jgi:8-oxo-dGTP pyrophosphatase MutT (NUDIX family)